MRKVHECVLNMSVYEELVEYDKNCIPALNHETNETPKITLIETFPLNLLGGKRDLKGNIQ